jgi:general secretion pathway protein A
MYAEYFGLRELPFSNTPDPRFFFATPDHEEALASLIYAVQERKGFVLLTGEVGAGKTLVSRMMLRHFEDRAASAVIHHSVTDDADLLQSIATEFELPIDPADGTTAIVRRLHDFLLDRYAQDTPVVLVLDEAQNLPRSGFEQLRMIGNLEADQAKLLQICFVGQPELQDVIRSRELRQLRQRIFRCFHLPPLSRDLTESYIRHRVHAAGGAGTNIFDMAALDRVFMHSRGIPRVINTLCDNAMLSAYSNGKAVVDEGLVDSVLSYSLPQPQPKDSLVGLGTLHPVADPVAAATCDADSAALREDLADVREHIAELRERIAAISAQVQAPRPTPPIDPNLAASLESTATQAEATLRRIDRACQTVTDHERRVQQLGKAVDGMATLLAPLAAKFEEITAQLSAQLIAAESAAIRLHASAPTPEKMAGAKVIQAREAERSQIFTGMTEAVANLRRAAQQVSTSQLAGLLPSHSRS